MKIVLASTSPRRAAILRDAGIPFEVAAATIEESRHPEESPEQCALRLAEAKARSAAARVASPAIVIGADTLVVVDGLVLGKPRSPDEARKMLHRLGGRTHQVITGLAVIRLPDGAARIELETTRVMFAPLSEQEVEDYVASDEPADKAGAYGIQGRGGKFVTRIEGCYFNVAGLPLARLYGILRELGWKPAPRKAAG